MLLYVSALAMIVVAAGKGIETGTDSLSYYYSFLYPEPFSGSQAGWQFLNQILNKFTNYRVFLLVCYTINMGGIAYMVRKKSSNYILSMLLYYLLFFYFMSFNVMRQFVAMGIVAIGYVFLSISNKRIFVLCVLIASLIHFSAICTLLLLYIDRLDTVSRQKTVYCSIIVSFIIGFFFKDLFIPYLKYLSLLDTLAGKELSAYAEIWGGERNVVTNLIINGVFVYSYYISKDKGNVFLKLWFLFILCSNMFGAGSQGNRLFLYLYMGALVAIPSILHQNMRTFWKFIYLIVILVYGAGVWYVSISGNLGDVLPYR